MLGPLAALALLAAPNAPPTLEQAVAFYESFQDDKARATFAQILAASPPRRLAAKTHIYLGLMALNHRDPDGAETEFELALDADVGVELPQGSSPKARLALAQARREVERKALSEAPPRQTGHAAPAPESATAAPSLEAATEAPPPSHSHALALGLGALALVAAAGAVVAEVDVATFNSTVTSVNAGTTPYAQGMAAQQSQAQAWGVAFIPLAIVAAAAGVGSVLTW